MIKGVVASSGFAIGEVVIIHDRAYNLNHERTEQLDVTHELMRIEESIRLTKIELQQLQLHLTEINHHEHSKIFDSHLLILEDPLLKSEILLVLEMNQVRAEEAVKQVIDKFVIMFHLLDDEYMKERAIDIQDIGNRLIGQLVQVPKEDNPFDKPFILITKEISPSQFAQFNQKHLKGIITSLGSIHSHVAIMARSMSIPYLLGVDWQILKTISASDTVLLDCIGAEMKINPDLHSIEQYKSREAEKFQLTKSDDEVMDYRFYAKFTFELKLLANIHSLSDIDQVIKFHTDGVGLFRTEFLFMNRFTVPTEEEQFVIYRKAIEALQGRPITIRTLDIGADKQLDYLKFPDEYNPSLGFRGIRVSLVHKELFLSQLRAILRASAWGPLKIMYPFIHSLSELKEANQLLALAKQELTNLAIPFDSHIKVGIMIEIPSAALMIDDLADHVDFFSIGTNDLTQYVLAVDRMNEQIASLFDSYHPALIRLIHIIVDTAKKKQIPVSICGEIASDPLALPLWIGMGVNEISIALNQFHVIQHQMSFVDTTSCEELVQHVIQLSTSKQISNKLKEWNHNINNWGTQ